MDSSCHTLNAEEVIAILRSHERELRASGIARLSLFGSVARGERGNGVDLMAEFDATRQLSLFDMAGLENRLADILGVRVDLAPARALKKDRQTARQFLPFKDPDRFLNDIAKAIGMIEQLTAGMDFVEFRGEAIDNNHPRGCGFPLAANRSIAKT